jgi:hypothetical protein
MTCRAVFDHTPWRALVALTLLALVFRLALAIGFPNDEPDDGRFYARLALNLLEHGVYSGAAAEPFTPTYVRVPGYPVLLASVYAVFGHGNNTAMRILQAAADTLACWVVVGLALALAPRSWPVRSRNAVRIAALALAALCPFTAIYVTTILTEIWAVFFGTLVAWCAAGAITATATRNERTGRWGFAAGLAAGVLTMFRPEGGLLAAGAGCAAVVTGWRTSTATPGNHSRSNQLRLAVRHSALLAVGFALVMTPWTVRNAMTFRVFQPIAPQSVAMPGEFVPTGYQRWLRTWVDAPKFVWRWEFDLDRSRFDMTRLPAFACDSENERREVAALVARYNDGSAATAGAGAVASTGAPATAGGGPSPGGRRPARPGRCRDRARGRAYRATGSVHGR